MISEEMALVLKDAGYASSLNERFGKGDVYNPSLDHLLVFAKEKGYRIGLKPYREGYEATVYSRDPHYSDWWRAVSCSTGPCRDVIYFFHNNPSEAVAKAVLWILVWGMKK